MIIGLLIAAVFIMIIALVVRELHRVLYVREVHHLARVTEHQARENCAPLSSAIVRHVTHE